MRINPFVLRDIMTQSRKYHGKGRTSQGADSFLRFSPHYSARNGCDEASLRSMRFLEANALFVVFACKIWKGGLRCCTPTRANGSRMRARYLRIELHRRLFQLVYKLLPLEGACTWSNCTDLFLIIYSRSLRFTPLVCEKINISFYIIIILENNVSF